MNSSKIWTIAHTLLLSQLRASARSGRGLSLIRRPLILIIVDVLVFGIGSGGAYLLGLAIVGTNFGNIVGSFISNAIVILPALITGLIFLLGLVLELSVGSQFASSDTVNWLPVTASDYVAASTVAIVAYYSVFPVFLLSVTMSLTYLYGLFSAWELAATLSVFGIIFSASMLEILKAVLNRFSTSFYKRGGRAALAIRAIFGVLIIVVLQLFFSPTLYTRFLGAITPNFSLIWFVPFLWSSVSVSALVSGEDVISGSFAALTIALSFAIFYGAVVARSKYWVPAPASIRISTASYSPRSNTLLGFLNQSQLAIARKDLRGLVRRREMLRFLALPGVFFVISIINAANGFSGFEFFGYFVTTFSALFVSISSIGSEGKAIANLYQFPLGVKDFFIGKGATPVIFGSIISIIFFTLMGLLAKASLILIVMLTVSGITLTFEITLIGMTFGLSYPNFSETRSSFISPLGGALGSFSSLLLLGTSLSPLAYFLFFQPDLYDVLLGLIASMAITFVISLVFYRIALGRAQKLLSQLPT